MAPDNEELIQPPRVKEFKPIETIVPIGVQLVVITALEISSIILVINQPKTGNQCKSYFFMLYLHGVHWFVALVIDHIVKRKHYSLRMNGYLQFYRNTMTHHRLPFYIVSLWTAVLLVLQTLIQHFYLDGLEKHCLKDNYLTPLTYFCAIISLEFIVLGLVIVSYIRKVYKFNQIQPMPDVLKEDWMFTTTHSNFVQDELGYGIQQCRLEDLLENQADMIQYLRENNEKMNERIMVLNAQLQMRGPLHE